MTSPAFKCQPLCTLEPNASHLVQPFTLALISVLQLGEEVDLFPNIPFPFLFLFLFLPLLQEFTFILRISLVYFTFHMFYLGTSMPRSRLSFSPPRHPQDKVVLSQTMCSLSPGPKVQIVFGNWFNSDGQSQILPQFFLPIVIYFRAT